jgi:hypothetical protein
MVYGRLTEPWITIAVLALADEVIELTVPVAAAKLKPRTRLSWLDEQNRVSYSVAQDRYRHRVRSLFLVVELGSASEAIFGPINHPTYRLSPGIEGTSRKLKGCQPALV